MTTTEQKTVFITGGAGYVGSMLTTAFAARDSVDTIILLDKDERPEVIPDGEKITYIQKNLLDDWQDQVSAHEPDIVVHAAWQIRELYWQRDTQRRWNIGGSRKVFTFALRNDSVDRLIHFSTVAAYGAFPDNKLDERFVESDPLRKSGYSYADEKRESELMLRKMFKKSNIKSGNTAVSVLRPASITGPWGRDIRSKFGLQSALSGQLDTSKSVWHWLIDTLLFFTPVTKKWARQFVHEDDVISIVSELVFDQGPSGFSVYNLAPPGPIVTGEDMAAAVGKTAVEIPPQLIRFVFFWVRHLSVGKIPTSAGTWKTYSYPIVIDGSKVTEDLGYEYSFDSITAFTKDVGRFAPKAKDYTDD